MFRPPTLTLLTPGQIGGLSAAHNDSATGLLEGLLALRADAAALNIVALGAGRFVSSSAQIGTLLAPPVAGPRAGAGLSVQIPDASYMVGGILVAIQDLADYVTGAEDGYITLDNVPPGVSSWGYLSLEYDEVTEGYTLVPAWRAAPDATRLALGQPCIGKVTADADSVTSIDPTAADVIWSQALLQARIAAGVGSGGGGGESGTGFGSTIPITDDDATSIKAYYDSKLGELGALVAKIGGNLDVFPAPFDLLADEIALNRAGLAEVNPHAIERGQISVMVANAGHGQDDTPDYSPDTGDDKELPFDDVSGTFGF